MMTNTTATLHGVAFQLPDGPLLFDGLDISFDTRRVGLIGRNGSGKSVLARILSGQMPPTRGRVLRQVDVVHVAQQIDVSPDTCAADLAGLAPRFDALRRIEAGSVDAADYERVGDAWDLPARWAAAMARWSLPGLAPEHAATALSGGERVRVALAAAFLSDQALLVLDEPSNHLDREHRRLLDEAIERWRHGLVIVSHDRSLLGLMQRILSLTDGQLEDFGGPYAAYEVAAESRQAAALLRLEHARHERRQMRREVARQAEAAARRQQAGATRAREANLPRILLGAMRQRSEATAGRLATQRDSHLDQADAAVASAAAGVHDDTPIVLLDATQFDAAPQRIAELRGVRLPYGPYRSEIDLVVQRGQRIALTGPNGSGKSTLLHVLAGRIAPGSGSVERPVPHAWLDQQLGDLEATEIVLALANHRCSRLPEGELRSRLALLGIDARQVQRPFGSLSGGQRMKIALALALYADVPAPLLLLDEPANHLDIDSLEALEAMLRGYPGTLIAVSHDEAFLTNIAPSHRIDTGSADWRLEPWRPTG